MPKHGSENLIENTHKAEKASIIRMTDLASRGVFREGAHGAMAPPLWGASNA